MLQTILSLVTETYRTPRRAVRSVIDGVRGPADAVMLFGLSFCLNAGIVILASLLAGGEGEAGSGAFRFAASNLMFSSVAFALISLLIWRGGRFFGGTGSLTDIATAVAWHSLVTTVFAPLLAASTIVEPTSPLAGLIGVAQIFMLGVVLWLMSSFVAEAHGFASAWRVAGVLFIGMMVIAFLLSIVLTGLISVK